jgi:hypothetical protein
VHEEPLDSLLARLREIQARGGVGVESEGVTEWYEVMLFPPAGATQVASVQRALEKRLPESFLAFWRATNGANLFLSDSGLHGVGVASTELMLGLEEEETETYGPGALADYAVFARVNGAGDFLVFELSTGRVLDGVHAEQPREWRAIADSFEEWLGRLIDNDGRYYWLEALFQPDLLEAPH